MSFAFKDGISIATTLVTSILLHFRLCHTFFVENIKRRYKQVPGKESALNVVINWISYVGIVMYLIWLGLAFVASISSNKGTITWGSLLGSLKGALIIVGVFGSLVATIERFLYLKNTFVKKLKGKKVKLRKRIVLFNRLNIVILAMLFLLFTAVIFNEMLNNLHKGNNIAKINYAGILVIAFFWIAVITALLVEITLIEIIEVIRSDAMYEIITEESIYCMMYLEYKDYYLIIQDGVERYISKGKVKEIRKIGEGISIFSYK